MALQKKLKQGKAQLERKATKPAKRKVSSLERKLFLTKRCSVISGSKKRQASTERDLPTAKRSRKLSKRQLSTHLGASEEDNQLLTEQLTNAQDMVKKLRTENLSLQQNLIDSPRGFRRVRKLLLQKPLHHSCHTAAMFVVVPTGCETSTQPSRYESP